MLHWSDEIRSAEGLAPKAVDIDDSEVDEAMALMEAIGSTDISQYRDQYREAVEAVIQAKTEGVEPPRMEAPAEPRGKVVDLMSALQDSVRAAKEARGEEAGEAEVRQMPAKKAKKAAAKKTARKRSAS
ncbi:hypothetical protein [Streptomyces violaceusniger]|uniref:hypothetical protein n=1 Tax=Streptomyces violaceusniger TaxID=68280 RepID=UPI0001E4C663|nr:hypothetical protein [Streptomyces violaceusniger]